MTADTFLAHYRWMRLMRACISGSVADLDDAAFFMACSLPVDDAARLDALNRAIEDARIALRDGSRMAAVRALLERKHDILPPSEADR